MTGNWLYTIRNTVLFAVAVGSTTIHAGQARVAANAHAQDSTCAA